VRDWQGAKEGPLVPNKDFRRGKKNLGEKKVLCVTVKHRKRGIKKGKRGREEKQGEKEFVRHTHLNPLIRKKPNDSERKSGGTNRGKQMALFRAHRRKEKSWKRLMKAERGKGGEGELRNLHMANQANGCKQRMGGEGELKFQDSNTARVHGL